MAEVAFHGQPALLRAIRPLEFSKATQKSEDEQSAPAPDTESDSAAATDEEVLDLGAGI